MPLQNRVDPWGTLNIHPSKQSILMGNRDVLHNENKQIVKVWKIKAWISCLTQFKTIKREIFAPKRYSELFFLDEATAFSAGYRPCDECQRERSNLFKKAWLQANTTLQTIKLSEIDERLHNERINLDLTKITYESILQDLPIGTCFEYNEQAIMIVAPDQYFVWAFEGYQNSIVIDPQIVVKVLTPKSIVEAFKNGFSPLFHHTVNNFSIFPISTR